ncbi:MAG: T9SS type A sorting domain-containing protein, partial [Opitutaceae bacterium]|nr:T9SS type A sorting domain-containing protein [Cytophagales bacterium]
TPGISSQNFDETLPLNNALGLQYQMNNPFSLGQVGLAKTKIDTMAGNTGFVYYNPHLKYVDLVQQGYMMLDVKKDSTQADWYYVNILDSTSKAETTGQIGPFKSPYKSAVVSNAANKLKMSTSVSAAKAKLDIPAPKKPMVITGLNEQESLTAIFSLYPNPATNFVLLNFGTAHSALLEMEILDSNGKRVKRISKPTSISAGNYVQEIDVSDLKAGIYFVKLTTNGKPVTRKLIVQ